VQTSCGTTEPGRAAAGTEARSGHAGGKLRVETTLPRTRACAAIARRAVEEGLTPHLAGQDLDDVKLVVSELVDNAYLHGEGEIRLTVEAHGDRLRVEVIDEGENAAIKIRAGGPDGLGGFGLRLVDQLSSAWGAYEGTTHVWAELRWR
jgi:anti-sigma regulatory factor (Ser/Thr protein kinase)